MPGCGLKKAAALVLLFQVSAAQVPPADSQRPFGSWGLDLTARDLTVRPGDNFYRYANGLYLEKLTIPPDRSGFTTATLLTEEAQAAVHQVLEDAATSRGANSFALRDEVGNYFAAFVDSRRIEQLGKAPLQSDLDRVRVATRGQIADLMGRASQSFYGSIFDLSIEADLRDPSHYAVFLGQPTLGLPDPQYYLDPSFSTKKAEYRKYVAALLVLLRYPAADEAADGIIHFETAIARVSLGRAQKRDPDKTYNPEWVSHLERDAPGFPWRPFFKAAGLEPVQRVILDGSEVAKIASIYRHTPLFVLRAWETFTTTSNAAPFLAGQFADAAFAMYGSTLGGLHRMPARWERAVRLISGGNNESRMEGLANLGDAVGRLYVARHFSSTTKQEITRMVEQFKSAFRLRLQDLDWMSPATREEALRKIDKVQIQVGYPDEWRDYSDLRLRADDLYGDVKMVAAFNWHFAVHRLFKPVDRNEWHIAPQTVNAYYYAPLNQIVLTAAVLQPPAFDPHADAAVNYGGIGVILAHELTHGYDDVGRRFDAQGRWRDWWTTEDSRRFAAFAAKVVSQFSTCKALPDLHVNGKLTLGENIADLGGLALALDAYHASLRNSIPAVLNGLTGDQRFFLGFAQVRRGKQRPEALRSEVLTDPHAPDECRVNTDLRNTDEWYRAFNVTPGDALYLAPTNRLHMW